jgi:hypothetical protein
LDLFSREAVERFVELLQRLSISAPQVASGRVLRDRLDGLVASTRAALQEAPWDLARYVQLERLHALRGDAEGRAMVLGVLSYFGVVEGGAEEVGRRGSWLEGGAVGLSEDELRRLLWPSEADGLRRNVLSMVWEAVSGVEPDDPKARGLRRGPPKPGDKRDEHPGLASVTRLAHALRLGGVELLVHPTDAYAVLPLLTPDPLLALGESTLERLGEPFHLFRVAHALESLRDGKLLVLRPSGMGVLAAVDELLRSVLPESGALPLFAGADKGGAWVKDGGAKLKRTVSRRTARDLRAALEVESFALPGDAASWTQACGCAAARAGLLACGRVGAALDAVAGTSFSAEREVGPARAQEVVAALRGRAQAGVLEDLLRFQVSEAHASLRRRLGLSKEGA